MGYERLTLKTTMTAGADAAVSQVAGNAPHNGASAKVWQTPGGTTALKSALVKGDDRSRAPRKSVLMAVPSTPSNAAAKMARMSIGKPSSPSAPNWRPSNQLYDPSMGPTPSAMTTKFRPTVAPSRATAATARSTRRRFQNAVCTLSNYTRQDFRVGDVIAAPFHTANTNTGADPRDPRLTNTCEGPAYSKRRMMVVLFIHQQDLHCLPLYSFTGRGITAKPLQQQHEYVCLRNAGEDTVGQGSYPPLEIIAHRPIDGKNTTLHLTGGLKVGCNEDITRVGRLTQDSYYDLQQLWKNMVKDAQTEARGTTW